MLPSDPVILLGFLNMKLRDQFDSPEELCKGMDVDPTDFEKYIAERGISYFTAGKRFVLD